MRCDECKHWKEAEQPSWEVRRSGFKLCGAIKPIWELVDKTLQDLKNKEGEETIQEWSEEDPDGIWDGATKKYREGLVKRAHEEKAAVDDASQFVAELYTASDFFCARFEKIG